MLNQSARRGPPLRKPVTTPVIEDDDVWIKEFRRKIQAQAAQRQKGARQQAEEEFRTAITRTTDPDRVRREFEIALGRLEQLFRDEEEDLIQREKVVRSWSREGELTVNAEMVREQEMIMQALGISRPDVGSGGGDNHRSANTPTSNRTGTGTQHNNPTSRWIPPAGTADKDVPDRGRQRSVGSNHHYHPRNTTEASPGRRISNSSTSSSSTPYTSSTTYSQQYSQPAIPPHPIPPSSKSSSSFFPDRDRRPINEEPHSIDSHSESDSEAESEPGSEEGEDGSENDESDVVREKGFGRYIVPVPAPSSVAGSPLTSRYGSGSVGAAEGRRMSGSTSTPIGIPIQGKAGVNRPWRPSMENPKGGLGTGMGMGMGGGLGGGMGMASSPRAGHAFPTSDSGTSPVKGSDHFAAREREGGYGHPHPQHPHPQHPQHPQRQPTHRSSTSRTASFSSHAFAPAPDHATRQMMEKQREEIKHSEEAWYSIINKQKAQASHDASSSVRPGSSDGRRFASRERMPQQPQRSSSSMSRNASFSSQASAPDHVTKAMEKEREEIKHSEEGWYSIIENRKARALHDASPVRPGSSDERFASRERIYSDPDTTQHHSQSPPSQTGTPQLRGSPSSQKIWHPKPEKPSEVKTRPGPGRRQGSVGEGAGSKQSQNPEFSAPTWGGQQQHEPRSISPGSLAALDATSFSGFSRLAPRANPSPPPSPQPPLTSSSAPSTPLQSGTTDSGAKLGGGWRRSMNAAAERMARTSSNGSQNGFEDGSGSGFSLLDTGPMNAATARMTPTSSNGSQHSLNSLNGRIYEGSAGFLAQEREAGPAYPSVSPLHPGVESPRQQDSPMTQFTASPLSASGLSSVSFDSTLDPPFEEDEETRKRRLEEEESRRRAKELKRREEALMRREEGIRKLVEKGRQLREREAAMMKREQEEEERWREAERLAAVERLEEEKRRQEEEMRLEEIKRREDEEKAEQIRLERVRRWEEDKRLGQEKRLAEQKRAEEERQREEQRLEEQRQREERGRQKKARQDEEERSPEAARRLQEKARQQEEFHVKYKELMARKEVEARKDGKKRKTVEGHVAENFRGAGLPQESILNVYPSGSNDPMSGASNFPTTSTASASNSTSGTSRWGRSSTESFVTDYFATSHWRQGSPNTRQSPSSQSANRTPTVDTNASPAGRKAGASLGSTSTAGSAGSSSSYSSSEAERTRKHEQIMGRRDADLTTEWQKWWQRADASDVLTTLDDCMDLDAKDKLECLKVASSARIYQHLVGFVYVQMKMCHEKPALLDSFCSELSKWVTWSDHEWLSKHDTIRSSLWNMYREVSKPVSGGVGLHNILNHDLETISSQLEKVLTDHQEKKSFLGTCSANPVSAMDLLQTLLDRPNLSREYQSRLARTLARLAKSSGCYPDSVILRNIRPSGKHPAAGGGFADVWKGRFGERTVALKAFRIFGEEPQEKAFNKFSHEAVIWRQLVHPNILPFYGVFKGDEDFDRLCLVSPWMDGGNMMQYIVQHTDCNRVTLLADVSRGLEYLHSFKPAIIHGDLKGANIFVNLSNVACLGDFGLARFRDSEESSYSATAGDSVKGTLRWQAPELVCPRAGESNCVCQETDVYAFACVCIELMTGEKPFREIPNNGAFAIAIMNKPKPERPTEDLLERGLDDSLWETMTQCWDADPSLRPSALELVQYFEQRKDLEPRDSRNIECSEFPEALRTSLGQYGFPDD